MIRIAVDQDIWAQSRFASLQESTGWTRAHTLGTLVLLWAETRRQQRRLFSRQDILQAIVAPKASKHEALLALIDAGYIAQDSDGFVLPDNDDALKLGAARSAAGAAGGAARPARRKRRTAAQMQEARAQEAAAAAAKAVSAPPSVALQIAAPEPEPAPKKRGRKPTPTSEANMAAWQAYVTAYMTRYDVEPLRNARVNAQVATFVQRVGQDVAPAVLIFYLGHEDPGYLQRSHDIGMAVRDAEALHTQWRRGRAVTRHDVTAQGQSNRLDSQLARIMRGGVV